MHERESAQTRNALRRRRVAAAAFAVGATLVGVGIARPSSGQSLPAQSPAPAIPASPLAPASSTTPLAPITPTPSSNGTATPSAAPVVTPTPVPQPTTAYEATLAKRVVGDGVAMIVASIDGQTPTISRAGALSGQALTPDTLFEIGSVTKTFTATLLALMVQDGEVALSDPVEKYLPARVHVPAFGTKKITLLSLATQHSGLPRLPTNLDVRQTDPYANYTVDDLYAFLDRYKLPRAPGAKFEYSNLGIGLLGIALANRAHLSYEELLQRRVLRPLGMTATTTLRTPEAVAELAVGHDADANPAPYWNFKAIAPAGAVISSAADMLKYLECNLGRGPLAKACLFAQQPRDTFAGHHIGLVWWIDDATGIIEHGGDTYAFHAGVAIAPDRSRGAVALTNGGTGAEDVALNAVDPKLPLAVPDRTLALDAAALAPYAGTYTGTGPAAGVPYVFAVGEGYLTASLGPQAAAKAYPVATDTFAYRVVAATVKFVRGDDGAVIGVRLYQGGKVVTFTRGESGAAKRLAAATPTPLPSALAVAPTKLAEYVGTYRSTSGLDFAIAVSGGALTVQLSGQQPFELFASADDRFFLKVVDAQIDFTRDASGVVSLTLHQNGRDIVATRVK